MPRHNGSHGLHHATRQKGGSTRRHRDGIHGNYDPAYRRADWQFDPGRIFEMGRKNESGQIPQAPKGPKGGSKGGPRPIPKVV